MNYVESFNLFGVPAKQIPCMKGAGAPTTSTEGDVGCLYMDTNSDAGDVYKCISAANGVYTWLYLGGSDSDPAEGSVLYTEQVLTPEQKAQARANIDAVTVFDLGREPTNNDYGGRVGNLAIWYPDMDKKPFVYMYMGEYGEIGSGFYAWKLITTPDTIESTIPPSENYLGDDVGQIYIYQQGDLRTPYMYVGAYLGESGEWRYKWEKIATGEAGKDGVSATHSWNGTTLTITSASGTSSANLKGEKGDKGDKGDQGIQGEKGETGTAGSNGTNGTSVTVKSVSESTADGGSNVVTFSDGKTLTIKNGSKGSKGDTGSQGPKGDTGATGSQGPKGDTGAKGADGKTPVRGTDYWTEADKAEIITAVIEALAGYPVVGVVDSDNSIVLSGTLPIGEYTLKYEGENGAYSDIVSLTITDEDKLGYTNVLPLAQQYASTDPYIGSDGSVGYANNMRLSSSSQAATYMKAQTGVDITGMIPVKRGDVIRFKNCNFKVTPSNTTYGTNIQGFDSSKALISGFNAKYDNIDMRLPCEISGDEIVQVTLEPKSAWTTSYIDEIAYIMIATDGLDETSIITINQEIV